MKFFELQMKYHWNISISTNAMSIEFEIRPKFAVLWLKMYSTHHNKIVYLSWHVQNFAVVGEAYLN